MSNAKKRFVNGKWRARQHRISVSARLHTRLRERANRDGATLASIVDRVITEELTKVGA